MVISKAAKRYAKAFFAIAQESNSLEVVIADFQAVANVLEQSIELDSFLKAPLITSEKRKAVLKALFELKVDKLTLEFFYFLERKNRLDITKDVITEFVGLHDELMNVRRIVIISAFAMDKGQVDKIKSRLQEKLQKNIIAEVIVDSSLIGGFKVKVGDSVFDLSIETQLNKLKQSIVKA